MEYSSKPRQMQTVIPFDGFYESATNLIIEEELSTELVVEQHRARDAGEEVPDDFTYDSTQAAALYVEQYSEWLENEHGIAVPSLRFRELISPREYNFVTDRIVCDVGYRDLKKVAKLWLQLGESVCDEQVADMFKSREGFASFYDDFVTGWKAKPVLHWDVNETGVLWPVPEDYYSVWESAVCNGRIPNHIHIKFSKS